jgi:DNA-binding transcriptional ArsR family regulator
MDIQKDKAFAAIPYNPDLFHNDREFYLAYRKVENIVAAVFLITGLIETDVLMKNAIREHSLQSLNQIVSLIGKPSVAITDIQAVASQILHVSSLLDIAFWSGQISQMNLAILQKEISTAYKTLNDLSTKYRNSFYIGSTFFKSDLDILKDISQKDTFKETPEIQKDEIKKSSQSYKGQVKRQEVKDINKGQSPIVSPQPSESKEQRRTAILALLRQRGNLTVKDFVSVVPQYSEKTIQRELLALVDEGVIRKEGERRWSNYSMAT